MGLDPWMLGGNEMLTPASPAQWLLLQHVLQSPWEPRYFSRKTKPTLLGILVLLSDTQIVGLIHQLWVLTYTTAFIPARSRSTFPPHECHRAGQLPPARVCGSVPWILWL